MNKVKKYTDSMSSSHEIVAYLMIAMNYQCAMKLKENETGIFRSSKYNSCHTMSCSCAVVVSPGR